MSDCSETPPKSMHLVPLDADHPGFRDLGYRRRRDAIARVALEYAGGDPVPDVGYEPEENQLWQQICNTLAPLHLSLASRAVLEAQQLVPLTTSRVPQLAEVNRSLRSLTGFRMEPVAGLIEPGEFLSRLADGIFLATQYIRHSSRPLYTPEPDVVHELLGHAATLGHPFFADLSRAFGQAARQAMERNDAETVENIGRLYWFTLEYGTVREAGRTQALGAGLLSSHGEIQRFTQAELRPFDPARAAATPYDPTGYQPVLYVAENIAELAQRCTAWLRASAA